MMTIRDITDIAGCHYKTVARVGKMMFPGVVAKNRGVAIRYTDKQAQDIIYHLPKKNMVQIDQPHTANVPATESSLTKKDLEMIGAIVANVMVSMEQRVSQIETRIEEKVQLLPPPAKDPRKELNQLVREYAQNNLNGDYRKAWNNLFKDFYYRLDIKVKDEAESVDVKPIDWLEKTGHLEISIAIIKELME